MEAHEEQDSLPQAYHVPVMLQESIDALNIRPEGIYADLTFGGGGHSKELLSRLGKTGKLLVFDQDADAKVNLPDDPRVTFIPHNFRHIQRFLRLHKIAKLDGVLADLGVSSHQFDEPERGFSIRFDAPMDMRMDTRQPLTAFDVLQTYSEQQLHKLFEQYGEVTNAKTLAKTIVGIRQTVSLKTISNFKTALYSIVKGNPNRYFAQVFQALRIEVNDELGALKEMLLQLPPLLQTGGRVAVITFHSLEDRLVKNFLRNGHFGEEEEQQNPFENRVSTHELKLVTKKPIVPGDRETTVNPRSRSAKLRVAEKK
ncbi:MAG: 16S rRNA (cytosine(1402)-N(4))-methyltransferase RsmH [Gemmatimonadaceae bacterium]|nr:16S rRNA (cytosine(1402)-N(4))-methyltransferase RsmH [Chitinophagaceae bacterium]